MPLSRFTAATSRSAVVRGMATSCFSPSSAIASTSSTSAAFRSSRQRASASSSSSVPPAPCSFCSVSSSRSYVTATRPASLATVVNSPEQDVARSTSNKIGLDDLRDRRPDPVVLSPVSDSAVDEAVASLREDIGRPIYLDMQATTPVDPRVLDAMLPYMTNQFGNPHSRTHAYGWETEKAVEQGRQHIADLVGAGIKDIVFTSGATESNNMAIKGIARFYGRGEGNKAKRHIITLQTEHKCVLDSCRILQDEGFEVTYLPVEKDGKVNLQLLDESIRPDTCLVSIMAINNEIGTIQPMKEIGEIVKKKHKGVFFHTDAAQAVGKIPINVDEWKVDVMSISGHKLYGPKGVGAAYVRRKPRVRLEPIINGGGQERGLRSGTVPAPLCVGLGEAARIAKQEMAFDTKHVKMLSDRLLKGVLDKCEAIERNGAEDGYPGCLNLSFSFVEGESFLMAMKDIALSSGSACTSASLEPSYVLRALGAEEDMAHSSIRFGIGRFTTVGEIDFVTSKIVDIVTRLRDLSPLWEMHQEGVDIKSINWSQH